MKLLFKPVSIVTGRVAGMTARKLTDRLWGIVDDEVPRADERTVSWQKLAGRLAIEGAVFAVVSGLADHASRRWFEARTGRWPGDQPKAIEQ
jgi:hypothetical protein